MVDGQRLGECVMFVNDLENCHSTVTTMALVSFMYALPINSLHESVLCWCAVILDDSSSVLISSVKVHGLQPSL